MMAAKPPKPRRNAVTIVAGFKSHEGVVVCADTQETIGQLSKHNVPKLCVEPSEPYFLRATTGGHVIDNELAVAFCGATDNGPYLDMVIDKAWHAARDATSLAEACSLIEDSIKGTHREYGGIYQLGFLPTTEIIYGVKMEGDSKLFYAYGPAVTEKDGYVAAGQGVHLANFLASRMHTEYLGLQQCIILAAYILFQTKEHVEGCGGDSQVAALRNQGTSGKIHWENIESITKLLRDSDKELGEILMQYADHKLTKEEFLTKSREALDVLATTREYELKKFQDSKEMFNAMFGWAMHDDLGLPSLEGPRSVSNDQTDEPEP
jgi:20S proteasome alpha/beta subunit